MGCESDDYKTADRWEFHGGSSNKFWLIKDKGDGNFAVWHGRCGKAIVGGTYKPITKPIAKIIASKEKKGYVKMESKGYDETAYTPEGKAKEKGTAENTATGEPPAAKRAKVTKESKGPPPLMAGKTMSDKPIGGDFKTVLDFVKANVSVYKAKSNKLPLGKQLKSDSAEIYKLAGSHWGDDIQDGKYYYVDIGDKKKNDTPALNKDSFEEGVATVADLVGESVSVWCQCIEDNPASEADPENFVPGSLKEEQVKSTDAMLEMDDCEWLDGSLRIDAGYFYWVAKQE